MDSKIDLKTILELHLKWVFGEGGGRRADLRGAYLRGADLQGAYLRRADLQGADLQGADLRGADLQGADLRGADLRGAYLQGADLQGADLQGADLQGAAGAELALAISTHLPEGQFDAWKKCKNDVLIRLRIPSDANRSHGASRKCRAEFVEVLEVIGADKGVSIHDNKTEYIVGQTVRCHSWDDDRWNTCAGGIHFYLTRLEAEAHNG